MFRKSFFSIFLIIILFSGLVLALSGCFNPAGPPNQPPVIYDGFGGFVGGPDGLIINVLDGAPPSVIMARGRTPFSFIFSLENAGEAEVGPGTDNPLVLVRLAGVRLKNFGLTEETNFKTLDSKLAAAKRNFDGSVFPGEIGHVGFDNLAYKPGAFESFALTLRGEVCYDYESYVTTKFCVKRDLFEAWEDVSICTLGGVKPVATSGAPLHITHVEEMPVNNDTMQISFIIEHVGRGIFFYRTPNQDLLSVCDFSDLNPNIYKLEVFVEPIQPDTYELDCYRLDESLPGGGAYGVVRMFQGAPLTVSCLLKRTKPMSVRLYEDMLNIKLRYRYAEFLEVPVLIQDRP